MKAEVVKQFIEQNALFASDERVLVALSGGTDSVALLRLLCALGYDCRAAHCNFHLRGTESDRDEAFVRRLCQELGVTLYVTHFDTQEEARRRKVSIEMAARDLRYAWFEEVRKECGAAVIAVAHHSDDSVETLLLNLIRGTGLNGLRGIRPKNGRVVRPLLCMNRQEILACLKEMGQPYVTDSTNLQNLYTRNKIRLDLLPLMQTINPSVKESLLKMAAHLEGVAHIYQEAIDESRRRVMTAEGISIEALEQECEPETVLYECLSPLGFRAAQVCEMYQSLKGQSGKEFVGHGWRAVKDRRMLLLAPIEEMEEPRLLWENRRLTPDFVIPRDKQVACLDADKLKAPLTLRRWRAGDTFVPFGMKGRKRVSDYLTDRKFSLLQKERQWVLCCGEEICWLVGERLDNRFRIDEGTKSVRIVTLEEIPEKE